MSGFIKLHRQLLEWEWFTDVNVNQLFTYCLLKANYKDSNWRGIDVKKGEFITSLESLSLETGLSVQQIKTALKKLIATNNLTSTATNKNRLITVVNYSKFQSNIEGLATSQVTSQQQTTNKQVTTDKNIKNLKELKEEKIKSKPKKKFSESVKLTEEEHQKLIVLYGSEINANEAIEILNDYIMSKGDKYKSHYHVMKKNGWVHKEYGKGNFVQPEPYEPDNPEAPRQPEPKPTYLEAPKVNQGVAAPAEFANMLKDLKGGFGL